MLSTTADMSYVALDISVEYSWLSEPSYAVAVAKVCDTLYDL